MKNLIILICLSIVVLTIIIDIYLECREFKKFKADIKVGDIYQNTIYPMNPFETARHYDVKILRIKDNWVEFEWLPAPGSIDRKSIDDFFEFPFRKINIPD